MEKKATKVKDTQELGWERIKGLLLEKFLFECGKMENEGVGVFGPIHSCEAVYSEQFGLWRHLKPLSALYVRRLISAIWALKSAPLGYQGSKDTNSVFCILYSYPLLSPSYASASGDRQVKHAPIVTCPFDFPHWNLPFVATLLSHHCFVHCGLHLSSA